MREALTVLTGQGYWSPLIWAAAALGTFLLAGLLWWRGRREYKRGTEQELPFVSGERVENPRVGALHLYWGLTEALRPFLERLRGWHSGVINDYAGWFVVVLGVVLLLLLL
ncbi:MAG: hydrogenase [Candidatus Bipolaricaulaceae bacterium]